MEKMQKNKYFHIHFIGIGGVSMSALARFMLARGVFVSGSDQVVSHFTTDLERAGALIYYGHNAQNIPYNCDLVVYTGAVHNDNVEYAEAVLRGIAVMERSEFLGYVAGMYDNVVAVSGTHGKTTTTSMLGKIFVMAGLNPTVHLGGESDDLGGNMHLGAKHLFVTEACEYRESFRYLSPAVTVVTNIENDHTDYYKSMGEIFSAFGRLACRSDTVVLFENDHLGDYIDKKVNVVTCGFDGEYDVVGYNLKMDKKGCYSFDVKYENKYVGRFKLSVIGLHNAKNALCAVAVALLYDVPYNKMYGALKGFVGVKRRYEKVGEYKGVPVVCDYAHHPTEILNSINGALTSHKKILCIFQPHTYSRTLSLMDEFGRCFKGVHRLVVYKTYPAREKPINGGRAIDLLNNVKGLSERKYYCYSKTCLKHTLKDMDKTYDLILVLGAGDIYDIVKQIVAKTKKSVD